MKTENEKTTPYWVSIKETMRSQHTETELIMIGELGASGIIDGMLPNGTPYVWEKRRDKMQKRKFKRK